MNKIQVKYTPAFIPLIGSLLLIAILFIYHRINYANIQEGENFGFIIAIILSGAIIFAASKSLNKSYNYS